MNEATKRCVTCEEEKSLSAFHLNGKYRAKQCLECVSESAPPVKRCATCRKEMSLKDFYKSRTCQYGVMARCKKCMGATGKYVRSTDPLPPERGCSTCKQAKPLTDEFWYRHGNGGFRYERKACVGMRAALRKYGLTKEQYAQMLRDQGGGCAICGGRDVGKRSGYQLSIDHCHSTNRVRGLLCSTCNLAIGYLRDYPELCHKAAAYLEKPLDDAPRIPRALCDEAAA